MSEISNNLASLVETMVKPVVNQPEEISTAAKESEEEIMIEITCNPDDIGKIIGRQGRIIKSIRTITRAAAFADGRRVEVEIME